MPCVGGGAKTGIGLKYEKKNSMFNIKYERLNKLPKLHKFQMDIIET
jgi:hypothetical protein